MMNLRKPIQMHEPADYQFELQGRLDPNWSEAFGGMVMSVETGRWGVTVTTLRGVVADQSQLHGILNYIRDLGIPLLKVEYLPDKPGKRDAERDG